jgi:hypothetical protein
MCKITHSDLIEALETAIKQLELKKHKQDTDSYFENSKQRPHLHWNSKYIGI